jgi:putative hydrolase of the HAD superfamily
MRAVLFDLDGTLMDHEGAREVGLRAQLTAWLDPAATEDERARLGAEWARLEALHYDEYTSGACSMQEQRRRRVRGLHEAAQRARPEQDEAADAWFAGYLKHYRGAWRAFEDALPALQALASATEPLRLGVVTNGEGEAQRAKLRRIGLEAHFAVVVASGEVGVAKPRREIFALACERLGVEPQETAHVGDRLDLDARAAAAAGLRGVWLDRLKAPHGAEEIEGVRRIASLHELQAALGA